jgi:hypothetical protein
MASEVTFHEVYGTVSKAQLRAYKRYNVSQSDHDQLYYLLGENYAAITAIVTDAAYHLGSSFSIYKFIQARL